MANWTADDPGRIDSGALGTTATTIQTTETSLGEARTAALTAQSGVSDAIWTGDAAVAWVSSLSTPIGKIDAVVPEMAAVRDAIATYTTTVDGIKSRANTYAEQIVQANLVALRQFMDPMGGPDPTEQARRDLEHQTAVTERGTAERLLAALSEERETADAALVSALSSPGGDSWDAQQAALAAIGITSAADLTPANIAQGMADMAHELGHGSFEPELATQLQSLYALYGNDPSVMAQMNLALGGEDLMSLISRIDDAGANGWLAPGAALLLAQSVRGGLSVGSQRWTSAVGQGFADDLWAGAAKEYGTGSWTGLAFLFGDEGDDTIGLTTTVGLANLADEYERGLPGATEGYPGPGQGILGPDGFLAMAEADQAGYDVNRLGDWTSRVFSTLGEYPEAAMDWLTDMGDDRVSRCADLPGRTVRFVAPRSEPCRVLVRSAGLEPRRLRRRPRDARRRRGGPRRSHGPEPRAVFRAGLAGHGDPHAQRHPRARRGAEGHDRRRRLRRREPVLLRGQHR
ncbi:MAG TPA: hypothetical protein VNJ54_03140 [Plantibacter sp.]|uniref:hypothetical protein n=1 Tax=unclassified Plantibacter TaxID=2624265 RepID=UPI002CDC3DBE|nr:hypothetical protein [Plantibacter sp.]